MQGCSHNPGLQGKWNPVSTPRHGCTCMQWLYAQSLKPGNNPTSLSCWVDKQTPVRIPTQATNSAMKKKAVLMLSTSGTTLWDLKPRERSQIPKPHSVWFISHEILEEATLDRDKIGGCQKLGWGRHWPQRDKRGHFEGERTILYWLQGCERLSNLRLNR